MTECPHNRVPDPTPEEIEERKKEIHAQRALDKINNVRRHTPKAYTGKVPWEVPTATDKTIRNQPNREGGNST